MDNIILIGLDASYIQALNHCSNAKFSLENLGELSYFLGIEVHINDSTIDFCQSKYVSKLLLKTQMQDSCKKPMASSTKLFIGDSKPYSNPTQCRSSIEALQYLTTIRPELSFIVNKLSQFLKDPSPLQMASL